MKLRLQESLLTHVIDPLTCRSSSVLRQLLRLCLPLRFSALHHAALTGTTELLSLLLEAQATVDVKDINGKQDTRDEAASADTTRMIFASEYRSVCLSDGSRRCRLNTRTDIRDFLWTVLKTRRCLCCSLCD